jgi:CheY-like chemotaxis protein
MDVDMPVMDGLAATSAIRNWESKHGGHTAIVAVTSSSGREECLAASMDAYIAKPLRGDSFAQTVQQVLGV